VFLGWAPAVVGKRFGGSVDSTRRFGGGGFVERRLQRSARRRVSGAERRAASGGELSRDQALAM
jgi:hypothetical protein